MTQLNRLERIVRDVLAEQFGGVVFDAIRICEGIDHNNDAVRYVRMAFRSDERAFAAFVPFPRRA